VKEDSMVGWWWWLTWAGVILFVLALLVGQNV
jgi:hypothetical protein